MSGLQRFDNLVLGSGEAEKYLAWRLAKGGQYSGVMQADRPLPHLLAQRKRWANDVAAQVPRIPLLRKGAGYGASALGLMRLQSEISA
jgi:hypothetical protein